MRAVPGECVNDGCENKVLKDIFCPACWARLPRSQRTQLIALRNASINRAFGEKLTGNQRAFLHATIVAMRWLQEHPTAPVSTP